MRYLLIDTRNTGHHITYITSVAFACVAEGEVIILMPPTEGLEECVREKNIQFVPIMGNNYFSLLKQVVGLIKKHNVDIAHFVYADDFLKFFGYGLQNLKCKVVFTFHQYRISFVRNIARKRVFKKIDYGVVHTYSICKNMQENGIKNVKHIEYPYFQSIDKVEQNIARDMLGIEMEVPVLLALGGTRYDKGLDILLEALQSVEQPFLLLIAGKEQDIKKNDIADATKTYSNKVKTLIKFLNDEEFNLCLSACDFVVLPYRKCFDGASGPLGEGVAYGKIIIGANHGSLGQLISDNHLGYVFQSEDCKQLALVISNALRGEYKKDSKYFAYREKLCPKRFQADYMMLYNNLTK